MFAQVSYPVQTARVDAAFRAVGRAVRPEDRGAWQRIAAAVADPLIRLAELGQLAEAADCDARSARQLLRALAVLSRLAPENELERDEQLEGVVHRADSPRASAILDEAALNPFAAAVMSAALGADIDAAPNAARAIGPLISASLVAGILVETVEREGAEGAMRLMSGEGLGMPPGFQDFIDGLHPGGRGLPQIAFPGRDFSDIDDPLHDWVDDILGGIRKTADVDEWEPIPWWWKIPAPQYLPPGYVDLIRCMDTVRGLAQERAAIPPPPLPTDAPYGITWADPITSLSPNAHCAGDLLKIYGAGLTALRDIAVVMIPTEEGCRAIWAPLYDWRETEIRVPLPPNVTSGPVGFADKAYVTAYEAWQADQEARLGEIKSYFCGALLSIAHATPFTACAPNLGRNYLYAGPGIIDSFLADGRGRLVVTEGSSFTLTWATHNCTSVQITRVSNDGPLFGGGAAYAGEPSGSVTLGPFTASSPKDAVYELASIGPCGIHTAKVTVALRRTPQLSITGVEFTQAIQTSGAAARSPLVADKPTIARVSVTNDLYPFQINSTFTVKVRGWLKIGNAVVPSINVADAGTSGSGSRTRTDDTLNFRIPAALSRGAVNASITVWTAQEFEQPPGDTFSRAYATTPAVASWQARHALPLRYVRVSTPTSAAPTDLECLELIVRAHDLLPTAPLDVAPAWMPTWHTSQDPTTSDGRQTLLDHLDDQHDCTLSEAIFPWEDDCPAADRAIWVGLVNVPSGGLTQGYRWFNQGRNSLVSPMNRIVLAHEIGHTQKLNHVNKSLGCNGGFPPPDYDSLPLGGMIWPGDAFDPYAGIVIPFGSGLWDMMTYACNRWISPTNWQRLFDKLG